MTQTIFALSSGRSRAGVAVIRISGPKASDTLLRLCPGNMPAPRVARLSRLHDPRTGRILDKALVIWFPEGGSFTGESSVELHVHGGRAVVAAVLSTLESLPGLRLAEPGEFTRRALENGKLDLTQVEALADLIDSDTEQQRVQALQGLDGGLGHSVKAWRETVLTIKMQIAADIDFSDEGDVGDQAVLGIDSQLEWFEKELDDALQRFTRGRIVSDGFRVAIVGKPNVGKSSLLNALAESDVAIVSEHAGTTRDVLEVNLDIGGFLVRLFDTAGFRNAADPVERMGVARAAEAMMRADLVLALNDGIEGYPDEIEGVPHLIRIRTKSDLDQSFDRGSASIVVSVLTGSGLEALRASIADGISLAMGAGEGSLITKVRHRQALERAVIAVRAARMDASLGVEFLSHHMESADAALASLIGEIGVEDVLGAVFSRFCVGK